jgi:hypothetical protein
MNVTPEFPILETSRSHYGGEGKVVILALRFGPVLWILPTSKGDKEGWTMLLRDFDPVGIISV